LRCGRRISWALDAAFIGLLEDGSFHVRWAAENGQKKQVDFRSLPGPASRSSPQEGGFLVG